MFILSLFIVALLKGAFSANETCIKELRRECKNHLMVPNEFPGTEDELKKACSDLEDIKKCLMERLNGCGSDDYNDLEIASSDMPRLISTLTEICQEDTELHSTYVEHMSCIKEFVSMDKEKQVCRDYTNNAMDYLRGPMKRKQLQDDTDLVSKYSQCLHSLLGMNCYASHFSSDCEFGAAELAIELLEKAASIGKQCPASIRIDIIDLLNGLESATSEEMYVKSLITSLDFY
ncbi:uncharacterized protein CDAR_427141 [Caerostris darwini]|uniref:Secreted protein n=1 Tax=Caerostris darwini TaxID=1538125 RepID=A0AAV4PKW0_9ARAC|nr:uncharacterized protein CDAR_427141 [Caerostris darwini]